jgi:hypothetical protein
LDVVLFHKAARVEALDIPEGSEVSAHTDHIAKELMRASGELIASSSPPTADLPRAVRLPIVSAAFTRAAAGPVP